MVACRNKKIWILSFISRIKTWVENFREKCTKKVRLQTSNNNIYGRVLYKFKKASNLYYKALICEQGWRSYIDAQTIVIFFSGFIWSCLVWYGFDLFCFNWFRLCFLKLFFGIVLFCLISFCMFLFWFGLCCFVLICFVLVCLVWFGSFCFPKRYNAICYLLDRHAHTDTLTW